MLAKKIILTGYLSKMGEGFPCKRITISPKRILSVSYLTRVIHFVPVRFEYVSRTTRSHYWRYGNSLIRMGFFSLLRWRLLKICETILSLVCCRFWQKTDASCSSWFMCILYGRWRVFSLLKYWSLSLTLMVQAVKSVNSSTGGHSSFPRVRKPIWLSISLYRFTFL